MFSEVRDGEEGRPSAAIPSYRSRRILPGNAGLLLAIAAATLSAMSESARGQANAGGPAFRVSVVDLADSVQRLRVPLYGSVTVETSTGIARADVIAPSIADVQVLSPTRLLVSGQGYGNTNILLQGVNGEQHLLAVSVELDLSPLNEAIRRLDPLASVEASSILGNIVLTGTASGPERAVRIVELASLFLPASAADGQDAAVQNHLEIAGEQQVLLRCVVAEVSRSVARELGINGFVAGDNFRDAFLVNQIGGINSINIGAAANALADGTIPFVTDGQGIPIGPASTLSLGFPRVQLQTFIKAMVDNSLLKILAEPNLVAISGQTATFLAGGEFPIPIPQGFQTISIQFREFGIRLNFTPTVRGNQRIRLRVAPEVSEIDFSTAVQIQGFVVPGLTTRMMETTVELGNGETIVIAGLLNEQTRALVTQVPGIGNVPILGALFRSINYQRSLTELVILVTAEIVAPLDAHQQIALPGQDRNHPSDYELYALGLIEGFEESETVGQAIDKPSPRRSADDLSVHGPWGHARPEERR